MTDEKLDVNNNTAESRFEIFVGHDMAFLEYKQSAGKINLMHTEVPEKLEGRGLGGKLARAAFEYAEKEQIKVMPSCPFIISYLKKHSEYRHLIV